MNRSRHIRSEFAAHQYLLAQTGATPHRLNRRRPAPPAFGTNRDPFAWSLVAAYVAALLISAV